MLEALFAMLGGGGGASLGSVAGGSMPGGPVGAGGSMPFSFGGGKGSKAADGALADASAMTAQGAKAAGQPQIAQPRQVDLSQLMAALQKRSQLGTGGL